MPVLRARYGWKGIARLAPLIWVLASLIVVNCPPFNLFVIAYFCYGLGAGLFDSGFCAWASKVPAANIVQGFMHGSFSVGCVVGPIVANAMSSGDREWYHFYWVLFGLAILEWVLLNIAFHRSTQQVSQESSDSSWKKAPKLVIFIALFYLIYLGVEGESPLDI